MTFIEEKIMGSTPIDWNTHSWLQCLNSSLHDDLKLIVADYYHSKKTNKDLETFEERTKVIFYQIAVNKFKAQVIARELRRIDDIEVSFSFGGHEPSNH